MCRLRVLVFGFSLLVVVSSPAASPAQPRSFWAFESGQVRPLAMAPSGKWLFAVNTPDARLEVFRIIRNVIVPFGSVPVGLEPVSVSLRGENEVWVVNHLSDSVSVVDVSAKPGRVVRTLLVGDEPEDVVFAGADRRRAFVTTAHRGQNSPFPRADYDRPGTGRADVWVFDAAALGSSLGGEPLEVLTLFADKPRALAVSPDGSRVYAAAFHSGNRTTSIGEFLICDGGPAAPECVSGGGVAPGGFLAPTSNAAGVPAPKTSLIVKLDPASGAWRDEAGRDWRDLVRFELPDLDVFEIDALADPPVTLRAFAGVGTLLFNLAVNPVTGRIYVSNSEARNEIRFEGAGTFAAAAKSPGVPASVRGRLHEARISVIDASGVRPRHLNKHIPYGLAPMPGDVAERSLATPLGMAVSADGSTLYVAAFGSNAIGVFDVAELEADSFVPDAKQHIPLSGGGPTGLVVDDARQLLYVFTRFDNAVSVVDLRNRRETIRWKLENREPSSIVAGRAFLYDARLTSSNGEASCSSCHAFGDMDDLAWDLGNPDGDVTPNLNPSNELQAPLASHPMKGPMLTQTLRGLATHGPMHWRGDRSGAGDPEVGDALDELSGFTAFNVAFDGLLGRDQGPLSAAEMQAFGSFALQLVLPPNPLARLDGSLRPDEAIGRQLFFEKTSVFSQDPQGHVIFFRCIDCHALDPQAGLFGANGRSSNTFDQAFKAPHLRNAYQKIGSFGMPILPDRNGESDGLPTGPQVRSSGFRHDGVTDTVFRFLSAPFFLLTDGEQRALEAFILAFPTNLAPIVGQQVTLTSSSGADVQARVDLLIARAGTLFAMQGADAATECDLVVKGTIGGVARGWLRTAGGGFRSDRAAEPEISDAALRGLAAVAGQELTYTCAPPGSGVRAAIDRNEDGRLDGDEFRFRYPGGFPGVPGEFRPPPAHLKPGYPTG